MNRKSYVHQISEIGPRERVRLRVSASAVASERRCVGVDRRCRESEGKAKIEGYMSVSDEEAHQRYCLKRHPMWFFISKRHPTWKHATKNATKNARNHVRKTRALPAPDDTAPAPFSPSLMRFTQFIEDVAKVPNSANVCLRGFPI